MITYDCMTIINDEKKRATEVSYGGHTENYINIPVKQAEAYFRLQYNLKGKKIRRQFAYAQGS